MLVFIFWNGRSPIKAMPKSIAIAKLTTDIVIAPFAGLAVAIEARFLSFSPPCLPVDEEIEALSHQPFL
jgi:hypothetical protein